MLDRNGIRRARRELMRLERRAHEEIAEARAQGKRGDDLDRLLSEWSSEVRWAKEEWKHLLTLSLVNEARKRVIPVWPHAEHPEYWEEGELYRSLLTDKGIHELRMAIRADQKGEWELRLAIAALIVGALGAATGLAAVLLR
jgi:hypothetical protein